ncbi:MAG: hypothetical protein H2069_07915 [Legionella sp.]|nr:hypothetical protein [Legionella sp.]
MLNFWLSEIQTYHLAFLDPQVPLIPGVLYLTFDDQKNAIDYVVIDTFNENKAFQSSLAIDALTHNQEHLKTLLTIIFKHKDNTALNNYFRYDTLAITNARKHTSTGVLRPSAIKCLNALEIPNNTGILTSNLIKHLRKNGVRFLTPTLSKKIQNFLDSPPWSSQRKRPAELPESRINPLIFSDAIASIPNLSLSQLNIHEPPNQKGHISQNNINPR